MSFDLLSVYQVADKLGISVRTVRRLIETKELPVHRIGRSLRVSPDDLSRYIAATRQS